LTQNPVLFTWFNSRVLVPKLSVAWAGTDRVWLETAMPPFGKALAEIFYLP